MGRKRKSNNVKVFAIGAGIAAAAGYVAGLLTAPKSGRETRKDLKQVADKQMIQAEKDLKKLHTELDKAINDAQKSGKKLSAKARKDLDELLVKAGDTKEKARELLSAIHEGDASDKDLTKAIKDANKAVDHLRDFLKK